VERIIDRCISSGIRNIYLAIDGPKNDVQARTQCQIISFAKERAIDQNVYIKIWHRKLNYGAAVGVISAIDWFFSEVESGIILEDDLDFDQTFIDFIIFNLERFSKDEDVWMISGNQFFESTNILGSKLNWSHYPLIWGWGTWRSAWQEIRSLLFGKMPRNTSLPLHVRSYWKLGYSRAFTGLVDAWDIPLAAMMRFSNKLCVCPNQNLVSNIGFGAEATHTFQQTWPLGLKFNSNDFHSKIEKTDSVGELDLDRFLEENLYKIASKHTVSYLLYKFISFPRRHFLTSLNLESRLRNCEPFNDRQI
jgi:hypothetical protein